MANSTPMVFMPVMRSLRNRAAMSIVAMGVSVAMSEK